MENEFYYTDKLLMSVVLNDYETVKSILQSGDYDKNLFVDVGGFEVPVPVTYFNKCWRIILDFPFGKSEDLDRKHFENAVKISDLFREYGIADPEIPFSKISYSGWAFEDESDDDLLEVPRKERLARGEKEIDLDLYIAVCRMDFEKADELMNKGANPWFEIEDKSNCLDLCETECSYQATCMGGELLRSPGCFSNGIEIDELGNLLRWAANKKMYIILLLTNLYVD